MRAPNNTTAIPQKVTHARKRTALDDVSNVVNNVNKKPVIGNENIMPQQVKPAMGVVTRKRALLMDRTNVSVKPTTASVQTHDVIKPIIKNENVVNLGFPAVEFNDISELDRKRSKKQKIQEWEDLDADDLYDPMTVSEYAVDIFTYLKELEVYSKYCISF